jgi:hypothetical protein
VLRYLMELSTPMLSFTPTHLLQCFFSQSILYSLHHVLLDQGCG